VNGGIKSHGEETQEGQENRGEEIAQEELENIKQHEIRALFPDALECNRRLNQEGLLASLKAALFSLHESFTKTCVLHQPRFLPVSPVCPPIRHSWFRGVCSREDPTRPKGDRIHGPANKQAGIFEAGPKNVASAPAAICLSRAGRSLLVGGWSHRRKRCRVSEPLLRAEFIATAAAWPYSAVQPADNPERRGVDLGLPLSEEW
jgi:hypothetical protein